LRQCEGVAGPSREEQELIEAIRRGDQDAFMRLVVMYGPALLRVARMYVPSAAVAEEVVQETWIGVLNGIDRFEGRSSLKTWIFRILTNIAKTRGERERRSVPFSSAAGAAEDGPAVDPDRFLPAGHDSQRGIACATNTAADRCVKKVHTFGFCFLS